MRFKVRVIGDSLISSDIFRQGFKNFERLDCDVRYLDWGPASHDELQELNLKIEKEGSEIYEHTPKLLDAVADADMLVTQFCPVNAQLINHCQNLKAIGVCRGGYENINVSLATQKNILVYHTPGRNANAVAEFTIGVMLCESRNIARAHANLKQGRWIRDYNNANQVPELSHRTVGIIGLGQIGLNVARKLTAFEMNILGYDVNPPKDCPDYIKQVSLEEIFRQSDFITLHARPTAGNERMIDRSLLSLAKPTAYFINTSRAILVNEADLCEALREGWIMGAALDVFDHESPRFDDPLLQLPNVTLTPHFAGGTSDSFTNAPAMLSSEMIKFLLHQTSTFEINPEVRKNNQVFR